MTEHLNTGQGRCIAAAHLCINAHPIAIEMGALPDVIKGALACVHHANRTGSADDFIAVALPEMRKARGMMLTGTRLKLFGSEAALSRLKEMDGMARLHQRGMIKPSEIVLLDTSGAQLGTAYVRDRSGEKHTAGWIRRSKARAARRGKPLGAEVTARPDDVSCLDLRYGKAVIHVRALIGEPVDAPLMVSTYGFSRPGAPVFLPVAPAEMTDAA